MSDFSHVYAVILAGGGGTRLWPESRVQTPKQFLKLISDKTMLQVTADRLLKLIDWDHMIIVTNQKYKEEVGQQLPLVPPTNIICEPDKRDTALAMLVGALYAQIQDPEAVIINAASDHIIINDEEFIKVMKAAASVAEHGQDLVTVGITPAYPSTGFGYVKIAEEIQQSLGSPVYRVESFTEKPDKEKAQSFIDTGKYYWNANMYVWSARALDAAFAKYFTSLFEITRALTSANSEEFHALLTDMYAQTEPISIDYAISEKADNLVLIPGNFGWNDVGDWKVVYELSAHDAAGNAIKGNADAHNDLVMNSHNNLVQTNGKLVALYGVDDFIIIDTPEILMVIPKQKSQEVKKLVEQLKVSNLQEYL